jgi:lipopolysaccharide transport system ATP-binding protein
MNDTVISVENLSKRYRIGKKSAPYGSLRESIVEVASAPFRRLRDTVKPHHQNPVSSPPSSVNEEFIWALKDISFEVKHGEVLGIIGRNGAGKSTLLKVLSRITKPTSGRAIVRGRVGSLLEVGTGFHPELTGRENIYLNGAVLGMTRTEIERKFDEIVDFAEIEQFLDTPTKRYSSGMYMRLAFAVAAHLEPEILLVDEVLAVGDAAFQKKCLGKMGEVAREGRTVMFVSHNMGSIKDLCTRCIHIDSGNLLADGKPNIIIKNYFKEQSEFATKVDLNNWNEDRIFLGPFRLTLIESRNFSNEYSSLFVHGETIKLFIGIQGITGKSFNLGISIRDSLGNLVLHLNNTDTSDEIVMTKDHIVIAVDFVNYLNDGTYYITLYLADTYNKLSDRVGNCFGFGVQSNGGKNKCQSSVKIFSNWQVLCNK